MKQNQFNDAELQVIERMAMAFEAGIDKDERNFDIISVQTLFLIISKPNPAEFIRNIRIKASEYVDRTRPKEIL